MNKEFWQQIELVFNEALSRPESERPIFLDEACRGDDELRAEVESLLAEKDREENLLSDSAFNVGLSLLAKKEAALANGQNIGSYTIIKRIGIGGMGEVYLAEDPQLARLVAIKILPAFLIKEDEFIATRFKQEALAVSAVSHPNVAHIYETGFENELHYMVIEYVEGKTLRQILKNGKTGIISAVDIALQIAYALTSAHAAGMIHRDIKPENVIVRDDGYVKVLDFGLAKLFDTENQKNARHSTSDSSFNTIPGLIMGTTNYMSPEQIRGGAIDMRTDIWSLGVVLYEMLAGRQPFGAETPSDVSASILLKEPEPLQNIEAEEELLNSIVAKSLKKELTARYQSAGEMAKDLKRVKRKIEAKLLASIKSTEATVAAQFNDKDDSQSFDDLKPAETNSDNQFKEKDSPRTSSGFFARFFKFIRNFLRF